MILFLICLNAGLFSLAYYTYYKNIEAVEDSCRSEQYYIAKSYERDYKDMNAAGSGASPTLLMQSYCKYYMTQNILLAFTDVDDVIYSAFPQGYPFPPSATLTHEKIDDNSYILIVFEICDGQYKFIYGKNVQSLNEDFRALMLTYVITAAGISAFLAVCLFFILKKLSVPLEKLRLATEKIICGDFGVAADESGNDEFSLLAKSFNSMVARINEQMNALEQNAEQKQSLVDNMAHEIRTPLTSIHGYAEYLEKAAISEDEKIEAAMCIITESQRLQKISEKLLDMAYIRNNIIKKEKLDLSALIFDVASKLKAKAASNNVEINFELEKSLVDGDEILLGILFYNLTENAIKACASGGMVTLSCSGLTALVFDNGKGMSKEQLAHITEPFYRIDKSRSRAEGGAGLGLALCKQIVLSHGAKIRFESEIGKGTKVFICFTS